ncbi:MAG: TIGR03118 family protein, partial [Cyanobacteria bacterium P01_F01_bin.33]
MKDDIYVMNGAALNLFEIESNDTLSTATFVSSTADPFTSFSEGQRGLDLSLTLPGVNHPIIIEREPSGLVHIHAQTDLDVFLGLGFVHAFDHLWQMDFRRRVAAGRLAEIVGPRAVEQDILQRTLGLYDAGASAFANLDPETKQIVEAYVAGINEYLALALPLPFEFQLLRYEPEPYTPEDVLANLKSLGFGLSTNFPAELLRAQGLINGFTLEQVNTIFPLYSGDETIISEEDVSNLPLNTETFGEASVSPEVFANIDASGLNDALDPLQSITQELQASNNWVIAGDRTTTGKPFLANDPHVIMQLPSIWHSVHLDSPNFNVIGASIPGIPGVLIGRNESIAWGITNSQIDVQDIYIIGPSQIETDPEPEIIEVRGRDPIVLNTRSSAFGPIISDVIGVNIPLALRWPGFELEDGSLAGFLGVNQAQNWEEFRNALETFVTPVENFVYADVDGNIGYIAPGKIPIRTHDGLVPVPALSRFDWQGFIPFQQLPQTFNPERGYIISANNRPAPDSYPFNLGFEWAEPLRAERIRDLLESKEVLSFEDMQEIQLDRISYLYRDFKPVLQAIRPILNNLNPIPKEALRWLNRVLSWDGDIDSRSRRATVFESWYNELTRFPASLIGEEFLEGPALEPAPRFLLDVLTQEGYLNELAELVPSTSPEFYLNLAAQRFVEVIDSFEGKVPRWGEIHQATFSHPVLPINRQIEAGGDRYTINVGTYSSDTLDFDRIGPTYRQIIDLGDLNRSVFIQSPGQSGRILSPFFDNLLSSWNDGQYRRLSTDNYDVLQRLIVQPVDALVPASWDSLGYVVTNLVSNNPDNDPQLIDPLVSLGWGIAIRPAGLGGHFWINNSGTGTVTEYVGDVGGVPIFQDSLKVVKVTPTAFNPFGISGPTGQVFNGSSDFVITQDHPNGAITAPSKFIFVASDGGISAWTERRNDDGTIDRPLESEVVVDKLGESVYYGAAITNFEADNLLYAVDFGPTPGIEVYDATFTEVTEEFEFINPFLDEGYAPYNIQNVNDSLFVAYAVPSPVIPGDEVIGPGLGKIAEFDLAGNLVATWEDESLLNAPWGFVAAPDNFGEYSNTLLVSNFGDGTIVAFDPTTRTAVDYLRDGNGDPIAIDGLWGLTFGNGGSLGETNDLYFAAGNDLGDNPGDGVFGKVEVAADVDVPAPGGDRRFEGTDGDDLFVVSGDRNVFSLGEGNDTVTARGLNQLVNAGDGNNIISIGSGTVDLGEGENFVTASAGSSTVTAGSGDDTVNLVKGLLEAEVGDGNNSVTSGAGDDRITAGAGDDSVHAGAGTNTIALGEGDNTIDTIVNQGNFLVSIGQNTVTTGSGSDTFRIGAGEGLTTITNFDERDRFELVGFKPDFSGALSFSDLSIIQDGADTVIALAGTEDVLAVLQNTQADAVDASTFGEPIPNELEVGLFD